MQNIKKLPIQGPRVFDLGSFILHHRVSLLYQDRRLQHKYLCYLILAKGSGQGSTWSNTLSIVRRERSASHISINGCTAFAGLVLVAQDTTIELQNERSRVLLPFILLSSFFRILGFPIPSYLYLSFLRFHPIVPTYSVHSHTFQRLQPLSDSPVPRRNIQGLQLAVQLQ